MDFSFTDDQLAFREAVRDLLVKECPPEVVRAALPAPSPDRPGQGIGVGARADSSAIDRLWHSLAGMGVLGLLVPEGDGGLGMDEVTAMVVLEEAGYAAAPVPVVETLTVVAPLLVDPAGEQAHRLDAVLAGDEQYAVEAVKERGQARVRIDDEHRALGSADAATIAFERAVLGTAAQLVGLTRRMLDITVAYVRERHQFGAPIGSFQAIKHHLADARLQLEFAAPAVYAAAWALSVDDADASRDVSMAKVMASDAARFTAKKALQCHGAIGYTVEYDLHLYFKRAIALAAAWGDAAWHRDRVATALGA